MLSILGFLITIIALYCMSKLIYQAEQTQSQFSKGVAGVSVIFILILTLLSWYSIIEIGDAFSKMITR